MPNQSIRSFCSIFHGIGRRAQFNLNRRYNKREIPLRSDRKASDKALSSHGIELQLDRYDQLVRITLDQRGE